MTRIKVPYGAGCQCAELPDGIPVQVVDPVCEPVKESVEELIRQALDHPIGSQKLEEMVKGDDRILILVNDQTRPGPNREMAEAIVERLGKAGIPDGQIEIMIATGTHRAPMEEELRSLIGENLRSRIQVLVHDCRKNNVYLGITPEGLPVYVDRAVAEADFIVTTGLVAPHKAAGFSGGRKSIVPGVAGMETLHIHHSLPIRPFEPALGWMEENPFHRAAVAAARMVKVRFILNAVQDPRKQNIAMIAGDMEQAHAEGVRICREHNTVRCTKHGDVIITSPGGSPRDCNLYQAQKALATAEVFAADGGNTTLILVAQAEEGIGPKLFREWLTQGDTPEEVVERFRREGFSEGTNKAFEYARAMMKGRIIIVSEHVDPEEIRKMGMDCVRSLQEAVDLVLTVRKPEQVIVLPKAVSIIPDFEN